MKICKLGDPMFTKASDQVLQRNEKLIDLWFLLGNPIFVRACDPCPINDVYHEEFDKLCTTWKLNLFFPLWFKYLQIVTTSKMLGSLKLDHSW